MPVLVVGCNLTSFSMSSCHVDSCYLSGFDVLICHVASFYIPSYDIPSCYVTSCCLRLINWALVMVCGYAASCNIVIKRV
jgi:hypothetical protein